MASRLLSASIPEEDQALPKIGPKDYIGVRRFSDFLNSCCDAIPFVPSLEILNDLRRKSENIAEVTRLGLPLVGIVQ